jgi:hypothetical protein
MSWSVRGRFAWLLLCAWFVPARLAAQTLPLSLPEAVLPLKQPIPQGGFA